MRSVDTNVLVRLIARDDLKQVAAAEKFISKGAWVSQLVLAETLWVLESVYERTPVQLATVVEMLLAHQQIVLQEPEIVSASLELFRERPRIGFSDCLILEIARKAGHIPLGTFDRGFSKVHGASLI
jgi:predicted nucleic-acid-binding protein